MYDCECTDVDIDELMKLYQTAEKWIKTLNECDGRVRMQKLETLSEKRKSNWSMDCSCFG